MADTCLQSKCWQIISGKSEVRGGVKNNKRDHIRSNAVAGLQKDCCNYTVAPTNLDWVFA